MLSEPKKKGDDDVKIRRISMRLKNIIPFLRGDFIVLMPKGERLVVDPGNSSRERVKNAATVFMRTVLKQGFCSERGNQ
jgi:hypothetical protein